MQSVGEPDQVKEVQSGEIHFGYRSIRANHPKSRVSQEKIASRPRLGWVTTKSSMSPTLQRTVNQKSITPKTVSQGPLHSLKYWDKQYRGRFMESCFQTPFKDKHLQRPRLGQVISMPSSDQACKPYIIMAKHILLIFELQSLPDYTCKHIIPNISYFMLNRFITIFYKIKIIFKIYIFFFNLIIFFD